MEGHGIWDGMVWGDLAYELRCGALFLLFVCLLVYAFLFHIIFCLLFIRLEPARAGHSERRC